MPVSSESIEDDTVFVLTPAYRPDHLLLFVDSAGQGVLVMGDEDATNSLGVTLPAGSVIGNSMSGLAALDGISFAAASGPAVNSAPDPQEIGGGSSPDAELPAPLGG